MLITKRGKPVARLVPIEDTPARKPSIFGRLRQMGVLHRNIVASEFSDEEWDRMAAERRAKIENKIEKESAR